MSDDKPARKSLQQILKEAMQAQREPRQAGVDRSPRRPEKGQAKPMPDAERRRAVSRKVH